MLEYGMDTYNNDVAYARGELVMVVPSVGISDASAKDLDENFLAVILTPHPTGNLSGSAGSLGCRCHAWLGIYHGKMYDVYAPSLSLHIASACPRAQAVHSIHTKFIKKL